MKLREIKILVDENINPIVADFLRQEGFDVISVRNSFLAGKIDEEVMAFANKEKRVILTHDSDFGKMSLVDSTHLVGIIYLKPGHIEPEQTILSLKTLFREIQEIEIPFILVAKNNNFTTKIRLRKL
jgi:predicted nuclease of predicted toxin-antitoxin system